jgi:hypothetical protein
VSPPPSTIIKLKRSITLGAVPTTSDLEDGEIAVNVTDKKVFVRDGESIVTVANFNSSNTDLTSIGSNVLPSTTETYDLGSTSKRWRSLYLAGNTIDLAGATISSDGTGTITISASGATLPLNSNVQISGAVTKNIALAGSDGSPVQSVPFYTNSCCLVTYNTKLDFKADPDKIVANFKLNNGTVLHLIGLNPNIYSFLGLLSMCSHARTASGSKFMCRKKWRPPGLYIEILL